MSESKARPRRRRSKLKPGMCLKAFRLECERDARGTVNVEAHEVHTVIGEDDKFSESYINPDDGFFRRDPLSYERRRIYERSSFNIQPPRQRLKALETETDAQIIHVSDEPLEPKRFPPMKKTPGEGFRETNATEVIFGIDPSHGCPRPWVTPVAFRLIKEVWEQVTNAGGVFTADYDLSKSGWAMFHTMYICPAPGTAMYVQAFRVEPKTVQCCSSGWDHVDKPLFRSGGRLFNADFSPINVDVLDPVVFKPIRRILNNPPALTASADAAWV
ncbi:unnamed protein product [Ectocarpus sp. 12 AP-2014]